ncbi:Uncharacterised protein [Niallia circulans]|uniref:hypothetical protein n=1 Tax=Niallia circulans TaxID=1397 RepID=UPI00077C6EE0|nr:hypothetical protein [Niallia circulans]MDR4318642.1 hypothetical protein [Niallia circulans]MED3839398.1 hypothetical protein [Niallia circulans]MED4245381.1 hypothetical protein [Niallia circulans]MED4250916.1 hypothetical protein [Niallia circulans]QKH60193.1 hypothetical protein FOC77_05765 [Niallia circulans]
MSKLENNIKNDLLSLLGKYSETLEFVERLSETGELLFFGGAIRDIFIKNEQYPRDFDIAVKFKDELEFNKLIKNYEYKRNRFGGYKIKVSGIDFDIWDLNNTWAFKNTELKPSEENLAKSVYLNIDGVVYNFNSNSLYADLLRDSLIKAELDISLEKNPHVELNLLRALVFKKKYNMNMSNKLKRVFRFYLDSLKEENLISNLLEVQITHYKTEKISESEIKKELQFI